MSALAKPLSGILLLAFAGVSWAGCPEGQKQTYKGCEVVEEKATETQPAVQQEAKEGNSEILELGGFIAEEIQIEAAAGQGDTTEMTASPGSYGRGINWAWRSFKVILPGDDFEMAAGTITLSVNWPGEYVGTLETEETSLSIPLSIPPHRMKVVFDSSMLPSVDYQDMRRCGSFPNRQYLVRRFEEHGTIELAFDDPLRIMSSSCMYKTLSEVDQATVAEIINQIETIVEKGTEEGTPDAVYWKTVALRIKANGPLVIAGVVSTEEVGTNITVSEMGSDHGFDWFWRGFDVVLQEGSEIVQGKVEMIVSWTAGSEKEPDRIRLKFDSDTLPSIDYQKMRGCNGWDESLVREDSTIRLTFWSYLKFEASRCIYNKLSQADQALVRIFGNQIYNIVEKGTEGARDANYWKKIAFRIRVNSPFILSSPASGDHYCINAEDSAPVVYLAVEGNCQQSEHKPIAQLSAASKVRVLLKDIPFDAISAAIKVLDDLEDIPLKISSAEDSNLTQRDQRLGVTWPSLVNEREIAVLDKKYTEKERRDPWRQFKWTQTFSIDAADYDGSQQVLFASVGEFRPLGFQGPLATDTLGYLFDEESQALHPPLTGTIEAVPRRIYFGNVDEDPLPEIIIANTTEDGRSQDYLKAPNFFLNTDDGTAVYFAPPGFSHSILVNDFTGDGLDDVFDLVSGERAGKFYTGINLQKKSYKTYDFDNHAAISADLDNDGTPEIINTYRKYVAGVRTIDRKVKVYSFDSKTQAARQIQTIPLVEGKGAVEITVLNWLGKKVRRKAIPLEDGLYLVPLATYEACAFDFEHDGDVDVLWSLTWRKWKSGAEKPTETYIELIALENQGGTLVRRSDVFPQRVEIGFGCQLIDFNRDGWNDVYFKDSKHARIWEKIYLNNQDGTFSAMPRAWAQQMFGGQYEIEFSAFVEFDQQLTRFAVVAKNRNTPPKLIRQDFRYDGVETQ